MGFPRKYLNEGEEIVLDLRPHWTYFAGPGAALLASLVLAVWVVVTLDTDVVTTLALFVALVALGWVVVRWAKWVTTHFVVTTDRLIHRYGVLSKRGKEIPLERLNDISFHKTLIQRMVGAGDLLVESAGEQGQQVFDHFSHPERVQNEIHRQIELAQARDAARAAGHRELSPLEQLEKLDELRQRGVISQAEFEAKKAQLLDRL
jgi:uncharacterized membrane protein YdbT with pleckstrin-like domain